jgi:hypothetical protein
MRNQTAVPFPRAVELSENKQLQQFLGGNTFGMALAIPSV